MGKRRAKNQRVEMPSHPGTLSEPLANTGDRRHFMRVLADEQGAVRPAAGQSSHMLGSLALASSYQAWNC